MKTFTRSCVVLTSIVQAGFIVSRANANEVISAASGWMILLLLLPLFIHLITRTPKGLPLLGWDFPGFILVPVVITALNLLQIEYARFGLVSEDTREIVRFYTYFISPILAVVNLVVNLVNYPERWLSKAVPE